MKLLPLLLFSVIISSNQLNAFACPTKSTVIQIPVEEILTAMRTQTGYDVTATTNVARFQAAVLLHLVRNRRSHGFQDSALLIKHKEWFQAYLLYTGLTESSVPVFARLAQFYGQDQWIDCRETGIIKNEDGKAGAVFALNVRVTWPKGANSASRYSFEDTLATPHLKVTNDRVVTYRLLHLNDIIIYDDIRGLTGRPTSGILGMLFKIIGQGRIVQSKILVTADGLQIVRAKQKRDFSVSTALLPFTQMVSPSKAFPTTVPIYRFLSGSLSKNSPLHIEKIPNEPFKLF